MQSFMGKNLKLFVTKIYSNLIISKTIKKARDRVISKILRKAVSDFVKAPGITFFSSEVQIVICQEPNSPRL